MRMKDPSLYLEHFYACLHQKRRIRSPNYAENSVIGALTDISKIAVILTRGKMTFSVFFNISS